MAAAPPVLPPAPAPQAPSINAGPSAVGQMRPGGTRTGAPGMVAAQGQRQQNYSTDAQYNDFLTGSGPTATGFLNFDSYAAANGQAARDSAKRLNASTTADATKAQKGVYDVNDTYQKQLKAGEQAAGGGHADKSDSATRFTGAGPHLVGKEPTTPAAGSAPATGTTSQALTGDSTKPGASPSTPPPPATGAKQPAGTPAAAAPPPGTPPGQGGAAGPVPPPPAWGQGTGAPGSTAPPVQGAVPPAPVTAPSAASAAGTPPPSSGDPYRDMLARGAQGTYAGPTNLQGDPRYGQVGTDVRNAQRELDATQTAGGLGTAAGGNEFDGALMNQQGQRAFGQTRDKFGNLNDFASKVDANAARQGDQAKAAATGRAGSYADQLAQYDKDHTPKPADAKSGPQAPAPLSEANRNIMNSDAANGNLANWGLDPNQPQDQQVYQALIDWQQSRPAGAAKYGTNNAGWFAQQSTEDQKAFIANLRKYIGSPDYDGKPFPYQPEETVA